MSESKNVLQATDGNFQSAVMQSSQLALVDFWAEWCGPCRILGPVIDQLAQEYTGKMQFFKLNVDENPNTPMQYGIRGIPTMLFFKNGQLVETLVGNHPKPTIQQTIQKHL